MQATDSDLVQVLDWYLAMGVDTATGEETVDWLARGPEAAMPAVQRPQALAPGSDPAGLTPAPVQRVPASPARAPDAAETAASQIARSCATLEELGAALARFDGCALKATAKNLCFYRGNAKARLMLIGEAPGSDEDRAGKPFVGPAGQLLDKMLAAIGLTEADVHITNIVYWRPPGNRTPTPQEAEVCRPFLERQVELVVPDLVLLVGGAAAKQVLNETEGIMKLRGRWRELTMGSHTARAMATLHPAYLLRSPAYKRQAWRDLLAVKQALAGAG
jgi:DNA polymerase